MRLKGFTAFSRGGFFVIKSPSMYEASPCVVFGVHDESVGIVLCRKRKGTTIFRNIAHGVVRISGVARFVFHFHHVSSAVHAVTLFQRAKETQAEVSNAVDKQAIIDAIGGKLAVFGGKLAVSGGTIVKLAEVYLFVKDNPNCNSEQVAAMLNRGKSTAYPIMACIYSANKNTLIIRKL